MQAHLTQSNWLNKLRQFVTWIAVKVLVFALGLAVFGALSFYAYVLLASLAYDDPGYYPGYGDPTDDWRSEWAFRLTFLIPIITLMGGILSIATHSLIFDTKAVRRLVGSRRKGAV